MANPSSDQTSIISRGALIKDDNAVSVGWNYKNITTTATTLVKSGPGIFHSITFNKPIATGTVEIDDSLTNSAPIIGIITSPTGPFPVTLVYDVVFVTGLSVTTAVAAQDITISYI